MPDTNPSVSTALSSASAANFLSSFTASLGAGGALAGLFENLLAATETMTAPQNASPAPNAAAANTVSPFGPGGNGTSAAGTPDISTTTIGDIVSMLRDFVAKGRSQQNTGSGASNQAPNPPQQQNTQTTSSNTSTASSGGTPPANTAVSTTTPPTTQTTGTQSVTTGTAPAVNTTNASSNNSPADATNGSAASDPNTPPSLADLLAELQAILQMLQKQIQAAQAGAPANAADTSQTPSTPANANDNNNGNNQAVQDLLAAGGVMADLLALAQSVENKLGLTPATGDAAQAASTPLAVDPNLAALDTQLRTNLKALLDDLQTAVSAGSTPAANVAAVSVATAIDTTATTNNATATGDAALTDPTLVTTGTAPATTGATGSADTSAATPDGIIQGALATAEDFIKQITSLYGSNAPVSSSPQAASLTPDAVAASSGKGGTSPDAGADTTNTATTLADSTSQNSNPLPAAADAPKSANLYSFASQLSAARTQNGGAAGLPSAVEQVLLLLNRSAKTGNDQMTIQLRPAELGSINVKLDFASDGTVSGTVTAGNPDTLALLQKDSRSLERALQDAGLRADPGSLQFNLGGQANGNSGQTAQGQSSNDTSSNTTTDGLAALTSDLEAGLTDGWIITPGRVNIQV
jgi:flagellar hook-length control protein FliK